MITVDGITMPKPNVEHFNLVNPVYNIKNTSEYIFAKAALPPALITSGGFICRIRLNGTSSIYF